MRSLVLRTPVLVVLAVAAVLGGAALADGSVLRLPKQFRSWSHIRSLAVLDPQHEMYGFHDGYANPAALQALRSKARPVSYPDGATFVVSIYEVVTKDGITRPGAKRRDVVQLKDRTAVASGGWRFAAFDPAGRPVPIDPSSCFGCHARAKDADFVFATYAE